MSRSVRKVLVVAKADYKIRHFTAATLKKFSFYRGSCEAEQSKGKQRKGKERKAALEMVNHRTHSAPMAITNCAATVQI